MSPKASGGVVLPALPWLVILSTITCQVPPAPGNYTLRVHLREIYHTSPLNFRDVYNIYVAQRVWNENPTLAYNPAFVGNEYSGENDSCGIVPTPLAAVPLPAQDYPLLLDDSLQQTGWLVTRRESDGTTSPHAAGLRLFNTFHSPTEDSIPVFVLPRLVEEGADGSFNFRGAEAISFWPQMFGPLAALGPSIWFNARVNHAHGLTSTLAHELAHVLLDPQPPALWTDNSTAFLHIQTHPNETKLTRASTSIGPTVAVNATDLNRQNLIALGAREACRDAQFSQYVRLIPLGP